MIDAIENLETGKNTVFHYNENNNPVVFTVSKVDYKTYTLRASNNSYRVRWGNKKEIIEDLNYCLTTGHLPEKKGISWT